MDSQLWQSRVALVCTSFDVPMPFVCRTCEHRFNKLQPRKQHLQRQLQRRRRHHQPLASPCLPPQCWALELQTHHLGLVPVQAQTTTLPQVAPWRSSQSHDPTQLVANTCASAHSIMEYLVSVAAGQAERRHVATQRRTHRCLHVELQSPAHRCRGSLGCPPSFQSSLGHSLAAVQRTKQASKQAKQAGR